ncbi:hypothetical protein COO91_02020 [Nostoc flagelliforme CCNUN1]|uniref:Uncharacterized protein n=1 Tax=Nostoc flagelliforme CCNUN1 TaxID=2038116 RepID=A0A2K8SL02_9NOSO|nr:hypothetical protein [Nostoc flagelliforme]AUB36119.1 hypothetical protein COO91_02020 [Nostoc flagelliforme CCNUN1]
MILTEEQKIFAREILAQSFERLLLQHTGSIESKTEIELEAYAIAFERMIEKANSYQRTRQELRELRQQGKNG